MKAKIEIQMDGAAFEETCGTELGRILRELAHEIENNGETGPCVLRDINGDKVGKFEVLP